MPKRKKIVIVGSLAKSGTFLKQPYKKNYKPNDFVLVLNNTRSHYCDCIGYCWKHHCYLTSKQVKSRLCAHIQCSWFKKIEDCSYWKKRRQIKELKKMKDKPHYLVYKSSVREKLVNAILKIFSPICNQKTYNKSDNKCTGCCQTISSALTCPKD